jgi:hypothetical protein
MDTKNFETRGRKRLPNGQGRSNLITIRISDDELKQLDETVKDLAKKGKIKASRTDAIMKCVEYIHNWAWVDI